MQQLRVARLAVLFILTIVLAAGPGLTAQETGESPADETTAATPDERVAFQERIVVTAQRREESLADVPIALSVFSSQTIAEAGIERPDDFVALTPNVFLADSFTVGNSLITSRGVSQINNGDPPMAVVVDGVYQGNQKQFARDLFDIERIELLKGPEGALYGRNSIGGAVNIVTRQPTRTFEGFARASLGNGSGRGLTAAVSGPMTDTVSYRASASYRESDGLIENAYVGREADSYEDLSGRLQLRHEATERLSIDWRAAVSDTEGGAVLYSLFPPSGAANDFISGPDQNILGFSERDLDEFSVHAEWAGDALSVTAITSYTDVQETYRADGDLSNPDRGIVTPFGQLGQGQDLDVSLLSQEIRLASPDDRPLRWLAGAYVLETDRTLVSQLFADTDGTIAGFAPIVRLAEDNDNTAWALFGQVDFDVGARWIVSASARYDRDERDQFDLESGVERSTSFDALQPRITVSFKPNEKLTAYLNAGTGFRSGGFNAPTVSPDIFEKEISRNVELGFKSTLLERRLRFDGAIYASRLDDAQYFRLDFVAASQIIDNMRDVEVFGVELNVAARPVQGLEVYASWGYNDSEIRDLDGSGSNVGNQTPSNIHDTLNVGAQYAHLLTGKVVGIARVDLERRGKQYWMPDNLDVQDPFSLLNVRLSATAGTWSVTAWGKNLTDESYYVEYGDQFWNGIPSGDDIGWLGRPRSYGVDITRKF